MFITTRNILLTVALLIFVMPGHAQFWKQDEAALLPAEEAFQVVATTTPEGVLIVDWSIAEGYYMYREQFSVEASEQTATIGALQYPSGVTEDDPEFGQVEVYFHQASLRAPLQSTAQSINLTVKGQGCNKPVGVCYPPLVRNLLVEVNGSQTINKSQAITGSSANNNDSISGLLISALIAGLLLSFTPCVLPMVPILAALLARQQEGGAASNWQSGWLAIAFVLGTITTYAIAGAVAGATGAQLQAYFQNIWIVGSICLMLLLLALSLFGAYRIELPSSWQTRLNSYTPGTRSASVSAYLLGLVSALVVGACVSPLLIVALGAAISQGDPILGAALMATMALGMGGLLIAFGFGAGWLLPRVGSWMQHIQVLFGFMVLAVALYLLGNFPNIPILWGWAVLLFVVGFYIWQLTPAQALLASITRALSALAIIWAALCVIGANLGGQDVLRPLDALSFSSTSNTQQQKVAFNRVHSRAEAESLLQQAKARRQPAIVDFYADWCLDCKRMQKTTYRDSQVFAKLKNWMLIEIDVTDTNAQSQAAKQHFDVFGPPATLFYNPQGIELTDLRLYGYISAEQLLKLTSKVQ